MEVKGHTMRTVTLEELLEAGCHFGHQVTRQNPKAREFVFEARDGVHIIDLAKTKEGLEEAAVFVKELAKSGGTMVVLGAKRQAEPIVREQVKRALDAQATGLFYVTSRWIGGLLTNFSEVIKNIKKLENVTDLLSNDTKRSKYTKKELSLMDKEKSKLEKFYGGVANLSAVPQAIFIIDTHMEDLAVREASAMNIPIVGITDTNADPTMVTYAIPANDDAAGSIECITAYIIDAWIEGKSGKETKSEKKAKEETASEEGVAPEEKTETPAEVKEEAPKKKKASTKAE